MKYVATFLVLYVIYILLAGFMVQELIVGAALSLVVTFILAKYVNYTVDAKLPIRLLAFIFMYIPVFIWQLILANFDVALRVLGIKKIHPGFVKVKTELEGDFAKLTLANSITLTPGTLSVDVEDDYIYVHTIDVKGETEEENTKEISSVFEKILKVVFK